MTGRRQAFSEELSRAASHKIAQDGVALLARAFNRGGAEEVPYRYSEDVQERFFELAVELVRLIEYGDVEQNPAHGLYVRALSAKSDKTLQALLKKAARRRPRRAQVFEGRST